MAYCGIENNLDWVENPDTGEIDEYGSWLDRGYTEEQMCNWRDSSYEQYEVMK